MDRKHSTANSFFNKLVELREAALPQYRSFTINDGLMRPVLEKGVVVRFDLRKPVDDGDLVVVSADDSVVVRELSVHNGEFYLVVYNGGRFARISMRDYRALHPGATFAGVVC